MEKITAKWLKENKIADEDDVIEFLEIFPRGCYFTKENAIRAEKAGLQGYCFARHVLTPMGFVKWCSSPLEDEILDVWQLRRYMKKKYRVMFLGEE